MPTEDSKPAFPSVPLGYCHKCDDIIVPPRGMSLRDWFAGRALPEIIRLLAQRMEPGEIPPTGAVAFHSFRVADSMVGLKACEAQAKKR